MNENKLELLNELLHLIKAVKTIQQISWSYSKIQKQFPKLEDTSVDKYLDLEKLNEEQLQQLINIHKRFVEDAKGALDLLADSEGRYIL